MRAAAVHLRPYHPHRFTAVLHPILHPPLHRGAEVLSSGRSIARQSVHGPKTQPGLKAFDNSVALIRTATRTTMAAAAANRRSTNSINSTTSAIPPPSPPPPRSPVILLDVMDTIVADPFFTHMPDFFGMSFKELLAAKHPTAWVEFERGEIDEGALFEKFFADGRKFDAEGLVECMTSAYRYIDGMPELLARLSAQGYEMHAVSNYPTWHRNIEEKLTVSKYLQWSFISCEGPMQGFRKPSPEAYAAVLGHLGVSPEDVVFIDDREVNVVAAEAAGMQGLLFRDAPQLEQSLREKGLVF